MDLFLAVRQVRFVTTCVLESTLPGCRPTAYPIVLVAAGEGLTAHLDIMTTFTDYPGDTTNCLDGLVLAKQGFDSETPHELRICKDVYGI